MERAVNGTSWHAGQAAFSQISASHVMSSETLANLTREVLQSLKANSSWGFHNALGCV